MIAGRAALAVGGSRSDKAHDAEVLDSSSGSAAVKRGCSGKADDFGCGKPGGGAFGVQGGDAGRAALAVGDSAWIK